MTGAARAIPALAVAPGGREKVARDLAEEAAVALSYDGTTQAVMMASPADLEEFALGFSLSEGIVARPDEIERLERVDHDGGIELRMWLAAGAGARLAARRRAMAGPVGCGLCGVDSLEAALRPLPSLPTGGPRLPAAAIARAMAALAAGQRLHAETRAAHAAGFFTAAEGLVALREDIGRHNALDKLVGALARAGRTARGGVLTITSRVSVDIVQKAVLAGAPVLAAVSAPTAAAVELAADSGLTLIARARGDAFEIYTHPERIDLTETENVA
ncbi:FdhD protein [Rhodovulum iodosum]|uniref:Sulfur carrier protein FdhD n=1 Tax=Rhodovulum iodosum TaxID=68291 RepID=A0ABV3XSY0_9RHOB|nr:formate dehydrogenase accessory sulfurtransferase FdhD [Rhodovulum robiginosum]RSK41033.1 formate dehydrogenase accessory sulfurtransferase FdhD [Rhodovulum robiginosum]